MARSLLFFSLVLLSLSFSSQSGSPKDHNAKSKPVVSAAHVELTSYGFPVGLLPANVRTYSINQTTGEFAVDLRGSCKITLPPDNYLATYSKKITGKIAQDRIAEINGIRVWALFKWWYITGIRSSGDNLVFEVGMVTAKYPSKNFDETPACEGSRSDS